jgi:hypothetical protein
MEEKVIAKQNTSILLQLASSEPGIRLDLPYQGSRLKDETEKRKIIPF